MPNAEGAKAVDYGVVGKTSAVGLIRHLDVQLQLIELIQLLIAVSAITTLVLFNMKRPKKHQNFRCLTGRRTLSDWQGQPGQTQGTGYHDQGTFTGHAGSKISVSLIYDFGTQKPETLYSVISVSSIGSSQLPKHSSQRDPKLGCNKKSAVFKPTQTILASGRNLKAFIN